MAAQDFLNQLQYAANALGGADTLGLILNELLAMTNTGVVSFGQPSAAANTVGLYKDAPVPPGGVAPIGPAAKVLWGAHVNFKPFDVPSFVHELTHARCVLCYQADMVNYAPGGVNLVVPVFGLGPPPGAPADTVAMVGDSQIARRQGWYRAHCKAHLDTNLMHLRAWADVTDFTPPIQFMDANMKAELKRLTAGVATLEEAARLQNLQADQNFYGLVMKSRKTFGAKAVNNQRLNAEKARKRAYIVERCNYGINGMGGLGDTHFEYDTVVNQMLYQMYLWGFRSVPAPVFTVVQLQQRIAAGTVPGEYLYHLVSTLAREAHLRRMAAAGIANGAPPVIDMPAIAIAAAH